MGLPSAVRVVGELPPGVRGRARAAGVLRGGRSDRGEAAPRARTRVATKVARPCGGRRTGRGRRRLSTNRTDAIGRTHAGSGGPAGAPDLTVRNWRRVGGLRRSK